MNDTRTADTTTHRVPDEFRSQVAVVWARMDALKQAEERACLRASAASAALWTMLREVVPDVDWRGFAWRYDPAKGEITRGPRDPRMVDSGELDQEGYKELLAQMEALRAHVHDRAGSPLGDADAAVLGAAELDGDDD